MNKLRGASPSGWSTNPIERKSYYVYFLGQNMIYTLVSVYLTTYLMFLGVDLKKTATIMLAVKIWDAVNDAIFGVIFDSVKFRSGRKYLPWLRISLLFIPLTTILLYSIPSGTDEKVKLIWFTVAYMLWDTAYTLCDVPIFGVITAMTENLDERNSMLSYKSVWGGTGSAVVTVLATVLVSEAVGSNYRVVALISSVIAFIVMTPACFKIQERFVPVDEEKFTLKRMFSYLVQNKYLLLYYLGFLFYSSTNVTNALNLFASYYLFNNSMFSLFVSAVGVVPMLVFSLLVPRMLRKMDKMKLFRINALAAVIISAVIWVAGYDNMVIFIILSALRGIPIGIIGVEMFLFTPDCAEYGKFKSGVEAKGITFAIQTFMAKLTGAISSALGIFLLGLKSTGWISVEVQNFDELKSLGIVQPAHALNVLWFIYIMIPAIGCAVAYIIWRFYKLNDKDVQIMADCNVGKITREEAESRLSEKY